MKAHVFYGVMGISLMGFFWCSPTQAEIVLDSFEGTLDKTTVDAGAAAGSSIEVAASHEQKACGEQSLKLSYQLIEGGYMYAARGYGLDVPNPNWEGPAPNEIPWPNFSGIRFQVYGSPSSGMIAFDVKDNGGEIFRHMFDATPEGWTAVQIPFEQFKVRADWQPPEADGNRTLDFPIQSYQWEPKMPGSSTLYFDCVSLLPSA